jgi:hypothetical protein
MSSESPRRRIVIKEQDLEELYLLVQGAPFANLLLDAKSALMQRDHSQVLELVSTARHRFRQQHARTLRIGDEPGADSAPVSKEDARQRQKCERVRLVLEALDDTVATLERMIKLRAGSAVAAREAAEREAAPFASLLSMEFRKEYERASTPHTQTMAIRRHFAVASPAVPENVPESVAENVPVELQEGQLYFLRGKEHAYLVVLGATDAEDGQVPLRLALTGQVMRPVARDKLLEMARRRHFVRLVPRPTESVGLSAEDEHDATLDMSATNDPTAGTADQGRIDKGTFTQLFDAAQRSGLVANADLIAHTRDREFRLKDYQKAFQLMEGLFGKFTGLAIQREQRLRREELDIAAGKLHMSPKQLMEKRARDIAESQLVDRARSKFLRLLEGLRIMMRT